MPNIAESVASLRAHYQKTGIWPLVLQSWWHADFRPWESGEFWPSDPQRVDGISPEEVLAAWWRHTMHVEEEDGVSERERQEIVQELLEIASPFAAEFPGMALPSTTPPDRKVAAPGVFPNVSGRLGLVAVHRPADALAVLGRPRGGEYYERDLLHLPAVVRSWEERFGAVVLAVGPDTLTLDVPRPPTTRSAALALAAEHYAVCGDLWDPYRPLAGYAADLVDAAVWSFWWD